MHGFHIFENSPDALFFITSEGIILEANREASKLFGYQIEELVKSQAEMLLPERFRGKNLFRNRQKVELCGLRKDKTEFPMELIQSSIEYEDKPIFFSLIREISEQKKSETVDENQKVFQELFEKSPDAVILIDGQGRIKQLNSQLEKLFGFKRDELYGQFIEILIPSRFHAVHKTHREEYAHAPRLRQMGVGLDLFGRKKDGSEFNVDIMLSPIKTSENISVLAVIRDITEKKRAETELKESVKKNAILLEEINHRVKNNLQIISSLLHLQSSHVSDPIAIEILDETRRRIRTIALIHEKLYKSKDFSKIDFSAYISDFTKEFFYVYFMDKKSVQFDQQIDTVYFNIETAIPCALIINEIISNSIKYAFPKNQKGKIWLKLQAMNGSFQLEVGDNGIGLPRDFDPESLSSFGLKLIQDLTKQLNGTVKVSGENGVVYTIQFKESVYKEKFNK